VFAVLREKYGLPEKLDIPREKLKSIGGIADSLHAYISHGEATPQVVKPPVVSPTPATLIPNGNGAHLSPAIAESFAALTPERKPFAGKVALLTGSGRGLGKDVACYLAELGASVIVNSFHSRNEGERTVAEIKDAGGDAIHAWGSVANPEHVRTIFDQIEATHGVLDFFISNASNGMLARLTDITPEHWEKAFRTNVVGLHQTSLRAVELMKRRGGGKIITLSTPASHGYVDYFGCMGAVKAAVESLTKSMAIEFAADNIQVNCVSPGPVYGDLLNKWPESERLIRQWESNTAYERLCEARDVSHFIAYLLSEPVKLFTGSVLIMDGGISSQGW
jgi:NAD(P)-dependent dehydrogenase (short-subunit alcohol dehydrogenase family)